MKKVLLLCFFATSAFAGNGTESSNYFTVCNTEVVKLLNETQKVSAMNASVTLEKTNLSNYDTNVGLFWTGIGMIATSLLSQTLFFCVGAYHKHAADRAAQASETMEIHL